MIHQQARSRKSKDGKEKAEGLADQEDEATSPVKTVLGTLVKATGPGHLEKTKERLGRQGVVPVVPTRIEDVPFRRQDRRTLNARYRRIMDRKLIVFIVGAGLLLLFLGITLVFLYSQFRYEKRYMEPFIVIGPVLIGGGIMTVLFSVEVCYRLYRANKRVQDPDLDKIVNPHEVKHWMDPQLIPFGWGLFKDDQEVITIEREARSARLPSASSPLQLNYSLPLMPTSMPSMSTIETPIVEESTTMESVMDSTMVSNRESLMPMGTSQESSGLVMRPSALGGPEARYAPGVSNL